MSGEIRIDERGDRHTCGYLCNEAKLPYRLVRDMIDKGILGGIYNDGLTVAFTIRRTGYAEAANTEFWHNRSMSVISSGNKDTFWYYDLTGHMPPTYPEPEFEIESAIPIVSRPKTKPEKCTAYICQTAIEAASLCALMPESLRRKSVFIGCGRSYKRGVAAAKVVSDIGLKVAIAAGYMGSFRHCLSGHLPDVPIIAPYTEHYWNYLLGGSVPVFGSDYPYKLRFCKDVHGRKVLRLGEWIESLGVVRHNDLLSGA